MVWHPQTPSVSQRWWAVTLSGDFIFLAPGDFRRSFADPGSTTLSHHSLPAASPNQALWQIMLDQLTEIHQTFDTHLNSTTSSAGRLDWLCVASPSWLVLQLGLHAKLLRHPFLCHQQEISDHAPSPVSSLFAPNFHSIFVLFLGMLLITHCFPRILH